MDAAVEGLVAFRKAKEGAVQGKPKPTAANNDNAKRTMLFSPPFPRFVCMDMSMRLYEPQSGDFSEGEF